MKKIFIYTIIFIVGIIVGIYFTETKYSSIEAINNKEVILINNNTLNPSPNKEFIKLDPNLLGKSLVVKGTLKEVFTNKDNEIVLHIQDSAKPIVINCTLSKSDINLPSPLRLGQIVNIQGLLCQYDGTMLLKSCKLLNNSPSINQGNL